jgi:hypothetical protein
VSESEYIDSGELTYESQLSSEGVHTQFLTAGMTQAFLIHHGIGGKAATRMRYLSNGQWSAWTNCPAPIGETCSPNIPFQNCLLQQKFAPLGVIPCGVPIQTIVVICTYQNGQEGTATLKNSFQINCGYNAFFYLN